MVRQTVGNRGMNGFTIVELLIVVVIIGVLAAIVIVAYNGVQHMAVVSSVKSDLNGAAKSMAMESVKTGAYPDVLPADAVASPGTKFELIKSVGGYSGLSSVQNGVLFQNICQQLISEGYGTGTNNGGGIEQYVTGCNVYNNNAMQINGWDARNFNIPINAGAISGWYNVNTSSDSWRPNKKDVVVQFANELDSRFQALGGVFPVASFWDPWANGSNGGVQIQDLGAPNAPSDPNNFCIQATHIKYTDILYHVNQGGVPADGPCS